MIQCQLKLRLTKAQESQLLEWLPILGSIWNFAVRKIELNALDHIYFSPVAFRNLLAGHSRKLGIHSHVLQGVLMSAYESWRRAQRGISKKPHLKGARNKINSIPFPDPFSRPTGNRLWLHGVGSVRFHGQDIPAGRIKSGRVVKRASGWYLCLFIDAEPTPITLTAHAVVGIDPGFASLLTLSTGQKIEHPRELERSAARLAQAQRGNDKQLTARLQERILNQRKDRNHKLSTRLVSENRIIAFSKDRASAVAHRFGKSVASSAHAQLRQMLAYKCRAGGRQYIEVDPANSTRRCSFCGALTGPTGLAQLSVRQWECSACGTSHDRDRNAAINTLIVGAGYAHEVTA